MTNSNLTVRELINDSTKVDPLDINTSEIRTLSEAMPKDGNIDLNNAEVLAVKYLRGADICGELMAVATAYIARTKSNKERAYNKAFIKYKDDKTIKTDKMRVAYAELDDTCIKAVDRYNEALAFIKWVEAKQSSFIKMHYMCKKILDRGYEHERASSFNGSIEENNEETW